MKKALLMAVTDSDTNASAAGKLLHVCVKIHKTDLYTITYQA